MGQNAFSIDANGGEILANDGKMGEMKIISEWSENNERKKGKHEKMKGK